MSNRETPAGFSRTLHRQVKALHAELKAMGYPADTIYLVVLDVMMRLAYEERGDEGATALLAQMRAGGLGLPQ